jgi:hypothetical protein
MSPACQLRGKKMLNSKTGVGGAIPKIHLKTDAGVVSPAALGTNIYRTNQEEQSQSKGQAGVFSHKLVFRMINAQISQIVEFKRVGT